MSVDLCTYEELIADAREVPYLIDGLLPERALVQVYGPSGVGKTFVALAAAHAVASGRTFLGRATKAASVVYIAGEGGAGMPLRARAWCVHEGIDSPGAVRYVRHAVATDTEAQVTDLLDTVRRSFTGQIGLFVIDTLAANATPGFDESSARDVALLIDGARRLIRETGSTVAFVHHTGWLQSRERGSSAFRAACDVVLRLESVGQHMVRLIVDKARDFAAPDPLTVELLPVADALVPILSNRADALPQTHAKLLTALQESPTALKSSEWESRAGVPRSSFFDAKAKLVTDELVAQNEQKRWHITPQGLLVLQRSKPSNGRPADSGPTASGLGRKSPSGPPCANTGPVDFSGPALHSENGNGLGHNRLADLELVYEADERRGLMEDA